MKLPNSFVIFAASLISFFTLASARAQMADASLFPETKSTNPAVISRRSDRIVTASVSSELTKKAQTLSTANGDSIDGNGTSDINVNTVNAFWGGKGPGWTTELGAEYVTGTKTDQMTSTSESPSMTNKATTYLGYLGLGINEHMGISYSRIGFDSDFVVNSAFQGQTAQSELKSNLGADDVKGGLRFSLGSLSIGGIYEHQELNMVSTTTNASVSGGGIQVYNIAGAGIGYSTKTFHLEGDYEMQIESITDPFTNADLHPRRITGVIEAVFGSFSIGYIGRYYLDGFVELERVMYNDFVYANSFDQPRLDNTVNFSFGTKGNIISASVYYTNFSSKEVSPFFQQGNRVDTSNTSYGGALKYSYAF